MRKLRTLCALGWIGITHKASQRTSSSGFIKRNKRNAHNWRNAKIVTDSIVAFSSCVSCVRCVCCVGWKPRFTVVVRREGRAWIESTPTTKMVPVTTSIPASLCPDLRLHGLSAAFLVHNETSTPSFTEVQGASLPKWGKLKNKIDLAYVAKIIRPVIKILVEWLLHWLLDRHHHFGKATQRSDVAAGVRRQEGKGRLSPSQIVVCRKISYRNTMFGV